MPEDTQPESPDRIEANLKPEAMQAVAAMFSLCEAIGGDVTMLDLMDVIRVSVKDGHEMAQIQLAMMGLALENVRKERKPVEIKP